MKKVDNKKRIVELWSANDLISRIESGELDLDTEYQRDVIWSREKKELLIDSMLNDIDIPKIYLAHLAKDKKYECIDGKQRIASVLDFYNNKIQSISGESYKEISDKNIFLDYQFSVTIIQNPTNEDISELFYRLNYGDPLNGGERINAITGKMRDFVFVTIGKNGPFLRNLGIRAGERYRFSRETALAQMIINSLFFREGNEFTRARYEDLRDFFLKYKNFDAVTQKKSLRISSILKDIEKVFDKDAERLNRKAAVVSAYLFCEEIIEKRGGKNLKDFPKFYLQLLDEMKQQAEKIKNYEIPSKKDLLDKFQHNLQQASAEGYSIQRRHDFLKEKFDSYLKTGKII